MPWELAWNSAALEGIYLKLGLFGLMPWAHQGFQILTPILKTTYKNFTNGATSFNSVLSPLWMKEMMQLPKGRCEKSKWGWWDIIVRQSTCYAKLPTWSSIPGERKLTFESCLPTSTYSVWHRHAHTCARTHTHHAQHIHTQIHTMHYTDAYVHHVQHIHTHTHTHTNIHGVMYNTHICKYTA